MIDSFPYQTWDDVPADATAAFWTFGPGPEHDLTGTFVMTGLGMALMIFALVYWVWLEHKKLTAQAEHLRGAGS